MTKKLNILMGAVAAAALISPAAFAWEDGSASLTIDQVELGNVWSNMDVHVGDHTDGNVGVGATSVGNTAAATVMSGDVTLVATQEMHGHTGALTSVNGGDVRGALYATTTSYANASTTGTMMGNTGALVTQSNSGVVSGTTNIAVRNVGKVATTTTAIANVATPSSAFGDNRSFTHQTNLGSSYAATNASLCCDNESADFVTLAGGNAVTSTGSSSTAVNGAVQLQDFGTQVASSSNVHIVRGTNVASTAKAAANSYTLTNQFGPTTLGRADSPLYQGNGGDVSASSAVTLDHWNGHAISTAYGVGNSALVGNVGNDTGLYANQENAGSVQAYAGLNGSSFTGGTGHVDATAINAATASLCTACGDSVLHGTVNQTNYGSTTAGANISAGSAGNVYGSATAVGNSATFTASGD